jgi:hypothetical protein
MLLFSVDNVAMNTLRYWKQHNELLRDDGNGAMNSSAMLELQLYSWPGPAQPSCIETSVLHWLLYKENGETQFSL